MSEVIEFGPVTDRQASARNATVETLQTKFRDDAYLLKWCAEWRACRAQQQKNWAEHDLSNGWGHLSDRGPKIDLAPVERMEELQWHLSNAKPRTMLLARELLGICATILAHRQLDPECRLADGPILEIIRNVTEALEYRDGTLRVGPKRP